MVEWNWEQAKAQNNPATYRFLRRWHNKALTEAEFIDLWLAMPTHKLRTSRRQPAKKYHRLKNKFGFFIGGNHEQQVKA